jgi:hypothetical protein
MYVYITIKYTSVIIGYSFPYIKSLCVIITFHIFIKILSIGYKQGFFPGGTHQNRDPFVSLINKYIFISTNKHKT